MIRRLELDVIVDVPAWLDALPTAEAICRRSAAAAFHAAGAAVPEAEAEAEAEASVVLSNDACIKTLNAAWRGKDEATNVLAFPAADVPQARAAGPLQPPLIIGDVIIALETAAAEARVEGKDLGDHLSHLVVHGMLHLLGYNHQTGDEADEMESLEVAVLASVGVADPYAAVSINPK